MDASSAVLPLPQRTCEAENLSRNRLESHLAIVLREWSLRDSNPKTFPKKEPAPDLTLTAEIPRLLTRCASSDKGILVATKRNKTRASDRLQRLVRPLLLRASDPPSSPKLVLVFLDKIWQWSVASFYEGKWSVWEYGEKHPVLWWINLPAVMLSGEPCTPTEYERLRSLLECGVIDALTLRSRIWRKRKFRSVPCEHRGWSRLGAMRTHDLRRCFEPTSSCGRVCIDA